MKTAVYVQSTVRPAVIRYVNLIMLSTQPPINMYLCQVRSSKVFIMCWSYSYRIIFFTVDRFSDDEQ